jgi:hypothetical protein
LWKTVSIRPFVLASVISRSVDDHVLAGLERRQRLFEVQFVGGGDHHQVDLVVLDQGAGVGDLSRGVAALGQGGGARGGHHGDAEVGNRLDQRRVQDGARLTMAQQAHADHRRFERHRSPRETRRRVYSAGP